MSDISELHYNSLVLKDFHIKTATYKHAIQEVDEKWELFIPTHFVYEFFIFNTLYSIDWQQSLLSKKIIHYRNFSAGEEDKQLGYINCIFDEDEDGLNAPEADDDRRADFEPGSELIYITDL